MKFTTLLVAAAALAAGIMVSKAQVYSQNVVGYANIPTAGSGTFALTVPFVVGVSNGGNEVWPFTPGNPTLPDGSELLVWNGGGFTIWFSDSGSTSGWDDGNQNPTNAAPLLPVGKGFFLVPAAATTNTFVGTVAVNVGTSNVTTLAGSATVLVAPAVPYGGAVTNGNPVTGAGGPNLWNNNTSPNQIPDGTELLLWNGGGLTIWFSDSGSSSYWDDGNQNPTNTPPTIGVGQSFFLVPAGSFPWTVGL
jgi:hypothetical protein